MQHEYDVVVIGGGPGGYAAGIRASQLGAKVALVEPGGLGGTCVNCGCIPARIWNKAAQYLEEVHQARELGINAKIEGIAFETIVERRKGISNDIQMGMQGLCQNNKITLIREKGMLTGPREIKAGEKTLTAKFIIIATGTSLEQPDIPGLAEVGMSTDEVFEMTQIPKSVLILGGGHIEVEMALLLSKFGAKVHLATEDARILPQEDADLGQRIAKTFRAKGIEICLKSKLESIRKSENGHAAILAGSEQKTIQIERVLVSARKPNTDIGLSAAGVERDDKGFIKVNPNLQTTASHIFAVGDVTGGLQLSYAATTMGVIAAENATGQSRVFDPKFVPRGLWTTPEAAAVGLTEDAADRLGIDVEIGECPLSVNGVAMAYGKMDGSVKVIADAEVGQILGIQIIGAHATELIWGASLAIGLEATIEDLANSLALHPTFSETIAMAGQDAMGWALYLPRSKKS